MPYCKNLTPCWCCCTVVWGHNLEWNQWFSSFAAPRFKNLVTFQGCMLKWGYISRVYAQQSFQMYYRQCPEAQNGDTVTVGNRL